MRKKLQRKGVDNFAIYWLLVIITMICMITFTGCGTTKKITSIKDISKDTLIQKSKDSSNFEKNTKITERYITPKAVKDSTTISLNDLDALKRVVTQQHPMIVQDSTSQIQAKYWFDAYNNLRLEFTSKPAPIKVVDSVTTTNASKLLSNDSKNVQIQYKDKIVTETTYRLSLKLMFITIAVTLVISMVLLQYTSVGKIVGGIISKLFTFISSIFSKK